MTLDHIFDRSVLISAPPPGATNVRIGTPVEGPGGRWVPCASKLPNRSFVPCVYEVGPGRKQVCSAATATQCPEEALTHAIALASTAAA